MTSSTPTPTPTPTLEQQDQTPPGSPLQEPWWWEWLKPVVVVAVISALVGVATLVTNLWMGSFQSLRADIRDGNAHLTEEIRASETRQREALRETKAELKADNQALAKRLDETKTELKADSQALRAELKADNQALAERLDETKTELKADNQALRTLLSNKHHS